MTKRLRRPGPPLSPPLSPTDNGDGAVTKRGEGPGGLEGVVLDLTLRGDGVGTAVYTVDAFVGQGRQKVAMQLDTGSSDTWLASTNCVAAECAGATLYDPSSSTATGELFDLPYLRGRVSGPVVWDQLDLGGYVVGNQALAAVEQVENEPLSSGFTGLLGLSFPQHSAIARRLPPGTTDAPDGAPIISNIFGQSNAPQNASAFLSFALGRPGMNRVPSVMGIGRHPSGLVPDPGAIRYFSLEQGPDGFSFWRTAVYEINVWSENGPKAIPLPHSNASPRSAYPIAVLDTGGADIQTTKPIADAIYGAWDIHPSDDGKYYVPCNLQMNISFSFYNSTALTAFPLHPLDLSYRPPNDPSSPSCVGAIQASPWLTGEGAGAADMVLGVAFLRNVYMVLAQSPAVAGLPSNSHILTPMLGLMSLTNITTALNEFKRARIDGLPLDDGGGSSPSDGSSAGSDDGGSHGPSVAIIILLSVIGFFALCALLFLVRWWIMRRDYMAAEKRRKSLTGLSFNHDFDPDSAGDGWFWRRRKSATSNMAVRYRPTLHHAGLSEDEMRLRRFEELKKHGPIGWGATEWSEHTRVNTAADDKANPEDSFLDMGNKVSEFGRLKPPPEEGSWLNLGPGRGKVSEFGQRSHTDDEYDGDDDRTRESGYMRDGEDLEAVGTAYSTDDPTLSSLPRRIAAGIGAGGRGIGLGLGLPSALLPVPSENDATDQNDRPPLGTRLSSAEEPLLSAMQANSEDAPLQASPPLQATARKSSQDSVSTTRSPSRAVLSRPRGVSYGARPAPPRSNTRQPTLLVPPRDDRPAILEAEMLPSPTITTLSGTNDAHTGH